MMLISRMCLTGSRKHAVVLVMHKSRHASVCAQLTDINGNCKRIQKHIGSLSFACDVPISVLRILMQNQGHLLCLLQLSKVVNAIAYL